MHPVPASIAVRAEVTFHCVGGIGCLEVERYSALIQVHSIHVILKREKKSQNQCNAFGR